MTPMGPVLLRSLSAQPFLAKWGGLHTQRRREVRRGQPARSQSSGKSTPNAQSTTTTAIATHAMQVTIAVFA